MTTKEALAALDAAIDKNENAEENDKAVMRALASLLGGAVRDLGSIAGSLHALAEIEKARALQDGVSW